MYRSNSIGLPYATILIVGTLAAACSSEKALTVRHSPPSVVIESPADGTSFDVYQSINFIGEVIPRSGGEAEDIQARWKTGDDVILCEYTPVLASGKSECYFETGFTDAEEDLAIELQVLDERDTTASASITINIRDDDNEAPTITLESPDDDSYFDPEDTIEFRATASDDSDRQEDLEVRMTSDVEGSIELSSINPDSTGAWAANIPANEFTGGAHLITVTVYDSGEKFGTDTRTITIDGAPSAPGLAISPDPALSGEPLTVEILEDSVDPEGLPVTYTYSWTVEDPDEGAEELDPIVTPGIEAGLTQKYQYWTVAVTANDGSLNGPAGTASITIGNSPPQVDSVSIVPASPVTDEDLVAVPSGWFDQDDDDEDYDYQWTVNGVDVPEHTLPELSSVHTSKGDVISVTIIAVDSESDGEIVSSAPVTIGNTPPQGGVAVVTPSSPEPTSDLLCEIIDFSEDDDEDPIEYVFRWYVDGSEVPELAVYSDGPATVSAIETENLETWRCEVTPNDGTDDGTSFSDSVTISDESAPDAPFLETPSAHRNNDLVDLQGDCEAFCELTFYCSDSIGSTWTLTDTCTADGEFSTTIEELERGEITECSVTCTDSAGNESDESNTISTEVCDPEDIYENSIYGDSEDEAIDEWGALPDDGTTTINIIGNVLEDDDEDWYIITAADDVTEDLAFGRDDFNFEVSFATGADEYGFIVYRGDPFGIDSDSCTFTGDDGYTEYNWFNQDIGDAEHHAAASDPQACGPDGPGLDDTETLNHCRDDTEDFYIQVFRNASTVASCDSYRIQVSNGGPLP